MRELCFLGGVPIEPENSSVPKAALSKVSLSAGAGTYTGQSLSGMQAEPLPDVPAISEADNTASSKIELQKEVGAIPASFFSDRIPSAFDDIFLWQD